jgi:hypothetical protein
MTGLCKSIVDTSEEILLACLIDGDEISDLYMRENIPVLNYRASEVVLTQTRVIMSIVLANQEYMGKLKFIHYHMENADGLHFSLGRGRILSVMLKPQAVNNNVIDGILLGLKKGLALMTR